MAKAHLIPPTKHEQDIDIFSNKSALVLFWLLTHHRHARAEGFSVNELQRQAGVSIGQVHKVIKQLEYDGIVTSQGLRTKKKFFLKSPDRLLRSWLQNYHLLKKTKTRGFSGSPGISESQQKKLGLRPALHTASSELFGIKSTNLRSKEYYLVDWSNFAKTVKALQLVEMDRGYEILLVKPYYSALISHFSNTRSSGTWLDSYALLTFLDLFHFPLRGIEQAETFFRKTEFLNSICPWRELTDVAR